MDWIPIIGVENDGSFTFLCLDSDFTESFALNASHFNDILGCEMVLVNY